LVAEAEMRVEKGTIVLEKPKGAPRQGWAEASERLAKQGDDALAWPEFANEADKDIKW
jgi:antitoxin MazE